MGRTKLFISYSHLDDEWMERLKLHLALLERRQIVHVWSDTRIRVGERWETEIENALTESSAAVLMISPAFLASEYIWEKEMPRILRHRLAGMLVFPLITKPCAWRIASELAELEARPANGRALSLGADAAVDSDLADFVYELAALLGQMPGSVASEEADRIRRQVRSGTAYPFRPVRAEEPPPAREESWKLAKAWAGVYRPTNRRMRLVIRAVERSRTLRGNMEYPEEGAVTEIEGTLLDLSNVDSDPHLAAIARAAPAVDAAVVFREVREIRSGARPVSRDGEYRAIVAGPRMSGFWISSGLDPQPFELTREA
jgi:hypothetical protein